MNVSRAYEIILEKVETWLMDIIRLLPNILLSALVLVIGIYLSAGLKKMGVKLVRRFSNHVSLNNLFGSILYIFGIGITIFSVLSILNLDKAVTSILAGAGILGLALAFAFQDVAANFICGIFISLRRPIRVGDIVKVKDYMGKVEDINLRDSVLRTFQGQMVIIPNKDVLQNPIENFSLLGKRRIDLNIGVSYGEDLEQVREITLKALKDVPNLSKEDAITLFYTEFGGSSINFIVRIWINSVEQPAYMESCSEAIISIKKTYDQHKIVIPFPIQTLDFGIKGGVPLNQVMTNP
ncbi:mechanosensitive ion channel family protein [Pedobacter sp. PAMC26386]|nr:mechanosensitive ion channel family protein [Pedobacter sp. PAMC26386]